MSPSRIHAIRLFCTGLVVWFAGTAAHGQDAAALSIETVLATTLDRNPEVLTARTSIDSERGALVKAHDPFVLRPRVTLTNSRTLHKGESSAPADVPTYAAFGTASTLGASKLFRSGVEVASDVSLVRTSPFAFDGPTMNQFDAATRVRVPLMRGRGGGLLTATELAAAEDVSAAERSYRQTAAEALLIAAVGFWDYRAAYARAAILDEAAKRSQQSVDELEILIRADERPRSDIDLMLANAAAKRATAVQAHRQIVRARTELARAMGVDGREGVRMAAPNTEFPTADDSPELPFEPTLAETLARHDELAAAITRQARADRLRAASIRELRPRVDLLLTTGYTGEVGGRSVGRLFESLYRNVLGPSTSLQFSFEPTLANSLLRGAVMQAEADRARETIVVETLTRGIALALADALASLSSTRAQLASTREAVERARRALATVHRNFELGTATIFDRILAEDTVTNAELAQLGAQRDYAAAIAELQFARGALVEMRDGALAADPRRVVRVSVEDGR
jgi:outer membrane protein TolC